MITRLSDIIDSDHQAELLAFLLTATPRSFPVSELSRRLTLSPQAIAVAASTMEKHNLVKSFTKQQTKFYILNHRHAMVPQLKNSIGKEHRSWPDELNSSLKKLGNLTGIFLSGVFVGRPELVVDLLLVGSVNTAKLNEFLRATGKQFGGELNYSIMSAQEFRMRRDTFDRFIKDIFDYPHITLLDRSDQKPLPATPTPKPTTKVAAKKSVAKKVVKKVVKKTTPKPVAKKSIAKKSVAVTTAKKTAPKPVAAKAVKKAAPKPAPKKKPVNKAAKSKSVKKIVNKTVKKTAKKTIKKKRK